MNTLLKKINQYYTDKIKEYGLTPKGVDWKDETGQKIRFDQILKVTGASQNFSINDLGCGYGSLYDYMVEKNFFGFYYNGYDLSEEMIICAKNGHKNDESLKFIKIDHPEEMDVCDYTVASGIFNVKMHYKHHEWLYYVLNTIDEMNSKSNRGFAFNVLTKYSDKEYMRDDLFYADPCYFFDYCKTKYSRNVTLIHDYDLYEFTIIVKKAV